VKVFNSVSDLQAASLTAGQLTQTKRYFAGQDGGGATYLIKTAVDYGGTPDEYGDHTLAGGTIAVLQTEGSVNVKLFGAVGDGVADDTAAITSAVSTVYQASGGTVYFPAGTYLISAGIPIVSNVHYKGEGVEATTIKQSTWESCFGMGYYLGTALPGTSALIQQSAATRLGVGTIDPLTDHLNWSITGFTLDGNSAAGEVHYDDAFGNVIRLQQHQYGTIKDCLIKNSWNQGISVYFYSRHITIDNCRFENCGLSGGTVVGGAGRQYTGNAIFLEFAGSEVTIQNCDFSGTDQRDIWVTSGETVYFRDIVISGNTFDHDTVSPVIAAEFTGSTYPSGEGIENLTISDNTIYAYANSDIFNSIFTLGVVNLNLSGNTLKSNDALGRAIRCDETKGVVSNNTINGFKYALAINAYDRSAGTTWSDSWSPLVSDNWVDGSVYRLITAIATPIISTPVELLWPQYGPTGERRVTMSGGTYDFVGISLTNPEDIIGVNPNDQRNFFPQEIHIYVRGMGGAAAGRVGNFKLYLAQGLAGGGGFRYYGEITTATAIYDPDSTLSDFAFSYDEANDTLTVTNNSVSWDYSIAMKVIGTRFSPY